jgi:hypothetical protein
MRTIDRAEYDTLLALAQTKANEFDQTVAIVIYENGHSLVCCPAVGNRNEPDMSKVNALLDKDSTSEILEIVAPAN